MRSSSVVVTVLATLVTSWLNWIFPPYRFALFFSENFGTRLSLIYPYSFVLCYPSVFSVNFSNFCKYDSILPANRETSRFGNSPKLRSRYCCILRRCRLWRLILSLPYSLLAVRIRAFPASQQSSSELNCCFSWCQCSENGLNCFLKESSCRNSTTFFQ